MPPVPRSRDRNFNSRAPRILCLSSIFDDQYAAVRGEPVTRCLSAPKRRDLFHCFALATGREIIVLSAPPRAEQRRRARWLPAVETRFDTHRQLFAPNWDIPKLRIPLSWLFCAFHTLRHTRQGDLLVIDCYDLLYVLAGWLARILRRVDCVLEYEDGRHLIDRSIWRILSGAAEAVGKPLMRAAVVAHPSLTRRLPDRVPSELVPGFVVPTGIERERVPGVVRFLYSGTLDSPRGVDVLISAAWQLPEGGWTLDLTGSGPMAELVAAAAAHPHLSGKVKFHGSVANQEHAKIVANCDVGLNCQRASDPISSVTFPSKIFSYLSAGLDVLSSRASEVDQICGAACSYYDGETPEAVAAAMRKIISNGVSREHQPEVEEFLRRYSLAGTAERIRHLLVKARLITCHHGGGDPSSAVNSLSP